MPLLLKMLSGATDALWVWAVRGVPLVLEDLRVWSGVLATSWSWSQAG